MRVSACGARGVLPQRTRIHARECHLPLLSLSKARTGPPPARTDRRPATGTRSTRGCATKHPDVRAFRARTGLRLRAHGRRHRLRAPVGGSTPSVGPGSCRRCRQIQSPAGADGPGSWGPHAEDGAGRRAGAVGDPPDRDELGTGRRAFYGPFPPAYDSPSPRGRRRAARRLRTLGARRLQCEKLARSDFPPASQMLAGGTGPRSDPVEGAPADGGVPIPSKSEGERRDSNP
jgi:hypothetical protein